MLTFWDRALIAFTITAAILSFLLIPATVGARGGEGDVIVTTAGRTELQYPLGERRESKLKMKNGWCKLEVRESRVRVVDSSCPKKLCVYQGWIDKSGQSIICLPHQVVIRISGDRSKTIDAVTQ